MPKEALKIENVKKDLKRAATYRYGNTAEEYVTYFMPFVALAIFSYILFQALWLSLLLLAPAVFFIILYIPKRRKGKKELQAVHDAIERADFSVSVKTLLSIAKETVHEPHIVARIGRNRAAIAQTRTAPVFYFEGGSGWRLYGNEKHYTWSTDNYLSTAGLLNLSLPGNEFYYIALQGYYDVSYVYPAKLFTLGEFEKTK